MKRAQIKLIYNPQAGVKRRMLPNPYTTATSLEDLKQILKKYQLEADFYPTKYPLHATRLAENAVKEGYKIVVVAGGDGTVGEAVNGLINSDITLGILPLGSFMNVARMLSVPLDTEKAVMLLKMGRVRKIDVGVVTVINGERLKKPYYFLESVGFGLEAQIHEHFTNIDNGKLSDIFGLIKTITLYLRFQVQISLDSEQISARPTIVNVANGPFSGPAILIAPDAKLNDHKLTVSILRMTKFDLFYYFAKLFFGFKRTKKPRTYYAKDVKITTKSPLPVHADARLFGKTPVELTVIPNGISVYTGFPEQDGEIVPLKKRTMLDP